MIETTGMRVGIFFGGRSREREISFAGGRTVFDNLNKALFDAVPIFVDSIGNLILLDWQYVYKGTIRDFYPPFKFLPNSPNGFQIYMESIETLTNEELDALIATVGKKLSIEDLPNHIDFGFLALHGPYGEDGSVQGILEWLQIPYSGSGILPSSIGINKVIQQSLMKDAGFQRPKNIVISKQQWKNDASNIFHEAKKSLGLPFVVKASSQGSSIGVTILSQDDEQLFAKAVNNAFFIHHIMIDEWKSKSLSDKISTIRSLVDLREGIGMPVVVNGEHTIYHPEELLTYLDSCTEKQIQLESLDGEEHILLEGFIEGKEFSCIVIQDENKKPIALPPTQIVKRTDFFDYRSKYLPGMSRKITPIDLPTHQIHDICQACERMFDKLHFDVYARIDGFITPEGTIILNDPNTTSGMLPSSFFFHQAAEIGMNPSQFLTYIVRTSLAERIKSGKAIHKLRSLLSDLDEQITKLKQPTADKIRVGVIMGGYSSERHISVESGRNIYEKLSSSSKYIPIPIFLSGNAQAHQLHLIPVNVMLKDNADDIKEKINKGGERHIVIDEIIEKTSFITQKYVGNTLQKPKLIQYHELKDIVDVVFIALHGRPGEDGVVQEQLNKVNIPYNGSDVDSSRITINKYETNERLAKAGILVAKHTLVSSEHWLINAQEEVDRIESEFTYPIIAKPHDDGCSSAVKKIKNREELIAFAQMIFRESETFISDAAEVLHVKPNEEFPQKTCFLVEELISANGASHFIEITGGMLSHFNNDGSMQFEVFEPSEALATGDVLSLEEKFLAGEGQNITPARFSPDVAEQKRISAEVRSVLEKTALTVGVVGYTRIDAFVRVFDSGKVETIIIEINSLPGMTPATCIFHQCAINKYKPYDFIDGILDFGMKRLKK